jgi:Ice-binding-like
MTSRWPGVTLAMTERAQTCSARTFEAYDMMKTRVRAARLLLSATTLTLIALIGAQAAAATVPAAVELGTAAPFAVLAGTSVTNTAATVINGDLGVWSGTSVTGFPPGKVNGTVHKTDAVAQQAQSDLTTAYNNAAGAPMTATVGPALGGLTLASGVYKGGALDLTGILTLDGQGNANSVWIFQATSSLTTATSSSVKLINGASPCNVFWQVTSSATLNTTSTFAGTILALTSITMGTGVTMDGRALARNGDVTLANDKITTSCPASTPTATPTPTATGGSGANLTPPPTDTLAPIDVQGSGPNPVLFVGICLIGFVVIAIRMSQRTNRSR